MMNIQQKPFGIADCNMHPRQKDFHRFFARSDSFMAFDEFIKLYI